MSLIRFKPNLLTFNRLYDHICNELCWNIEHFDDFLKDVEDYDRIAKLFFIKQMIESSIEEGWYIDE